MAYGICMLYRNLTQTMFCYRQLSMFRLMLIRLPAVAVNDQAQAADGSQQQQDQPGCEI